MSSDLSPYIKSSYGNMDIFPHARVREHLVTDGTFHIFKHLQNSQHCRTLCSNDCFSIVDHAVTSFQLKDKRICTHTIPHSINYEETGTSEGLWDRLGRTCHFSMFSRPLALLMLILLHRAMLLALKMLKVTCLSSSVFPNDPTILH